MEKAGTENIDKASVKRIRFPAEFSTAVALLLKKHRS
jgi:hypothetical protein